MDAINSEHCSYKSTKTYLQTLYTESPHVIQGPGENAGIIDIGNGYALALRIESHNHPSFVNPYEGLEGLDHRPLDLGPEVCGPNEWFE